MRHTKVAASAARTVNGNSLDLQLAGNELGYGQFVVDVTALSGTTPSITFFIEGLDEASGKYFTLLQSAAINAVGTTVFHVGPGCPVTANISANAILTKNFRVRWTVAGTTPSVTFTVGCVTA